MHRSPARIRGRTRRALLAATVAAFALPAAAQAGTVEEAANGTLTYRAASGERNSLNVIDQGNRVDIVDLTGLSSRTPLCGQVSSVRVACALGIRFGEARLGDLNDGFAVSVSSPVVVDGGAGDDAYTGGGAPAATSVVFRGGQGRDTAHYPRADRGVRISNENTANDGRIGLDRDNILTDVEHLTGSPFNDEITAMGGDSEFCCIQVINGGRGDDVLRDGAGVFGSTHFDMGRTADGADKIIGGSDSSTILYEDRTQPVTATLNFGGADDGEAGERDEITGSHELVFGGPAGDTLRAPAGSTAKHELYGSGGDDTLEGAEGPDTLHPGPGVDTVLARGGNDVVFASDLFGDTVACGFGIDTAVLDSRDGFSSCETRNVGVLGLAPQVLRAEAGETARLMLSWRHPKGWKQLKKIELRLSQDGASVGEVTIRPGRDRVGDDGALRVKRARILTEGKTVTAKLAIRLDDSLAGQTLKAEVEATDRRGARQIERDAATVRVS